MAVTIPRRLSWPIRSKRALKTTFSIIAIKCWSSRATPIKSPRPRPGAQGRSGIIFRQQAIQSEPEIIELEP